MEPWRATRLNFFTPSPLRPPPPFEDDALAPWQTCRFNRSASSSLFSPPYEEAALMPFYVLCFYPLLLTKEPPKRPGKHDA